DGRIVLRPFGFSHASLFDAMWDYVGDIVLYVPIGMAAMMLWPPKSSRRRPLAAFAAGVVVVGAIEFAQVFVISRFADVTDLITCSIGVALGIAVAAMTSDGQIADTTRGHVDAVQMAARFASVVWIGVLLSYHWRPFDFSLAHDQIETGLQHL